VDYLPRYFLINGKPYANAPQVLTAGKPGQKVLLRFLNAGLLEKTPTLFNSYETIVAEDGNLMPYPKAQYSTLLPAGKTLDSLFITTIAGKIALFDRSLNLSNGPVSPGGMLTYLNTQRPSMVDFDGEGNGDIAIYQPSTGAWYMVPSSGAAPYGVGWGGPGFTPVPGDYDGDGKTDVAIYQASAGAWWILPSSTATLANPYIGAYGVGWGGPGFTPVPGDYDGDGKTDAAIYQSSTGAWWIIPSSTATLANPYNGAYGVGWGGPAFTPVPGDYDGDGKTDVAIYQSSIGAWYIVPSSGAAPYGVGWGGPAFTPLPGDYDGDGKTDIAVYDASTGNWYIVPSSTGLPYGFGWGGPGFTPVPGDYDGDGRTDAAIYQASTGNWYIVPSSGAAPYGIGWGGSSFTPVTATY
jgi:hypothetical protein